MSNTFKDSIRLKVNKKTNLVHLSIRTSEYKVEVFKLPVSDIGSLLDQFREQMRDGKDIINIVPIKNEDTEPENSAK